MAGTFAGVWPDPTVSCCTESQSSQKGSSKRFWKLASLKGPGCRGGDVLHPARE